MTSNKIRPGVEPLSGCIVEFSVTQGVHPDEDCIRADVADLMHIGELTAQFLHSFGIISACIGEISEHHDGCTAEGCVICTSVYAATSVIHAFDIVNGSRIWACGTPFGLYAEGDQS